MLQNFTAGFFKEKFSELHSILISQNDETVFSAYYDGYHPEGMHEAQSITKSIQSLVLGKLMEEKKLSLETLIEPFFEDYPNMVWDESKKKINIYHVLTHTTGLEWKEYDVPYYSWQNDTNELFSSPNWIEMILSKKSIENPGQVFRYSSANPILLSLIMTVAAGMSNQEYLKEKLFSPLGIENFTFETQLSPKGMELLGDAYLFPEALQRMGEMVLNNGRFQGKQIIQSEWINRSLEKDIQVSENVFYGLSWWIKKVTIKEQTLNICYAWGYGGQHIFVIEKIRLVVVMTAGKYPLTYNLVEEPFQILENHIIPCYL